ncbi:MAG: DUF86 domain-containing protein [Methanothrix sp.]|uniref:DUF86 domain-containing protein n=1 Tax=Methanothrix harundinacea TaxID=301375 RepID=A0A117LFN3_9EURY|nr:MAG: hypothetical protein APR56_04280 [Methanosaeta sp. SDB]KUK44608.1 MAG: hypothetical protein XD72_1060 [Methanothrix harundinacea]MDD2638236.1 DUF86 domain-containing protein [Methanothrix sp.]KUK95545.1 MAG: hypothetical protein XE07_1743 [Methanothrix harundinacea]MCP1391405.1 DUF86 domain-containing protein [Methanothrix harundinacea]
MRSDKELLLDILEAIGKIERYASKGKEVLFEDDLIQTWIVYHFQIIGEAAKHLSDSLQEEHYFGIDLEQVWDTTNIDLPVLKANVEKILKDLDSGGDRSESFN